MTDESRGLNGRESGSNREGECVCVCVCMCVFVSVTIEIASGLR